MKKVLSEKDIQDMLAIIRTAIQDYQFTRQSPKTKSRGRPHKYPQEVIILAFLLKTHLKLTYRDLEAYMSKVLPKGSVPDFSSLFYRFKALDNKLLEYITQQIAHKIG